MDLTSSLHPMDRTMTGAALTSCSSLCPQGAPSLRDRLLDRHMHVGQSLNGPRVGLLAPVVLELRGVRGVNYHQQEGLPWRWLVIWLERGDGSCCHCGFSPWTSVFNSRSLMEPLIHSQFSCRYTHFKGLEVSSWQEFWFRVWAGGKKGGSGVLGGYYRLVSGRAPHGVLVP